MHARRRRRRRAERACQCLADRHEEIVLCIRRSEPSTPPIHTALIDFSSHLDLPERVDVHGLL